MHHEHIGQEHRSCDGSTVTKEVERKLFVQRRINGVVRSNVSDCVAVRRRTEDGSHSDVAASANSVFYYYLLAKFLRKELPDDSSDCVIRASRRKGYDPVNWPRRIGLRLREARHGWERGSASGQIQECAAGEVPFAPSPSGPLF